MEIRVNLWYHGAILDHVHASFDETSEADPKHVNIDITEILNVALNPPIKNDVHQSEN